MLLRIGKRNAMRLKRRLRRFPARSQIEFGNEKLKTLIWYDFVEFLNKFHHPDKSGSAAIRVLIFTPLPCFLVVLLNPPIK